MSSTPAFTEKQLKSTLSAKKNKPKEARKHVLACPFKEFRPRIKSEEDQKLLHDVIMHKVPLLKHQKNVPWEQIKHVPKEERKAARAVPDSTGGPKKNNIRLGVNEVTKLLEKKSAGAVLISGDTKPMKIVQHVVDMAVLHRVPVLILDDLKSTLHQKCGIAAMTFAIERDLPPDSPLIAIKECVENIFAKIPSPLNHINYKRSLEDIVSTNEPAEQMEDDEEDEEEPKFDETEVRKRVYLEKPKSGRAFVPQEPKKRKKVGKMDVDETGFLSFTNESTDWPPAYSTPSYKSLAVKTHRGNRVRAKNKLQRIRTRKNKKSNKDEKEQTGTDDVGN
ncbi:unnamed protein product [Phyllotreta striolata]|uniref:Ribosomal protein eL8/eL30/eS12/Gadd45 domain-containing protein n=1 Tax=Phyllotreta striolata TaxID=444603 RepID=A0A9N9TX02_PHYSR|nr:unnamed protein product [Phyllotreta striolata]